MKREEEVIRELNTGTRPLLVKFTTISTFKTP